MKDYSKDEDEKRQRLIVAQSSIKSAAELLSYSYLSTSNPNQTVIETAEGFYNWVFSKADANESNSIPIVDNSSTETVIPTPTVKQLEWLKKIEEKYGYKKEEIYKKYGKYPNSKDSSIECVKIMKGN